MKLLRSCCLIAAATLVSAQALALDAAQERAERDRIKAERQQVEADYARREKECREHFVVTSCVDDARRDRRKAMERLRAQQEVLDEMQRKQRAAERMDEIRSKVSGEDAKRAEAAATDRRKQKQRAQAAESTASDVSAPAASQPRAVGPHVVEPPHASPPRSAADEAQHVAEFEKRQREAQEHRDEVAQRNAQRAAKGKPPAKPLPVPGAASVAPAASSSR